MATFNRAAAKNAGYTDQEIDAYLAANPNGPPGFAEKQQRQQIIDQTNQVQLQSAQLALENARKNAIKANQVANPTKYLASAPVISTPTQKTNY